MLFSSYAFGQTGTITGTVKDEDQKILKEFTVKLSAPIKATVDLEKGTFTFLNVPVGTYTIEVKAPGFEAYISEAIVVTAEQTSPVVVGMKTRAQTTKDIRVSGGKVDKNKGDMEVTKMQINQAGVVDGMNKNTIVKNPDSRVSQVFKRVSGASVQDNKFVVVRGLSDRYNFALINGASLPSTESDRKAFSFDIFPSNMLENLFIMKSATPELPGEFAGGVIDIKTVEPRSESFQNLQIGLGFNTIATLKDTHQAVTKEGAFAKYFASEVSVKCGNEAVQIMGGYGYTKEYPAEKFLRDAKLMTIGEGTSEIQKLVIAREILK